MSVNNYTPGSKRSVEEPNKITNVRNLSANNSWISIAMDVPGNSILLLNERKPLPIAIIIIIVVQWYSNVL